MNSELIFVYCIISTDNQELSIRYIDIGKIFIII